MAIEITIRVGDRRTSEVGEVTWEEYSERKHLISSLKDYPLPVAEIEYGVVKIVKALERDLRNAESS